MSISFIAANSNFTNPGGATTISATALNVVAGDTVVVSVRGPNNDVSISGVTDTAGNIYRQACGIPSGTTGRHEVWYCTNCVANASNVVTATFDTSQTFTGIAVAQFRGIASISPLDVCSFFIKTTSSNNVTSNAFTTAVADSVIIACAHVNGIGNAWTPDSGYTEATEDASNVQQIQYKIVSGIQTGVTVTANITSLVLKDIIVISLHEEIAGGGGEHSAVF